MRNLQEFLKGHDVEVTFTNNAGEILNAGKAVMVKPYANKNVLRFETDGRYSNVFPFTYAVLHGRREVFDGLFIKPLILTTETVIEVTY